MKLSDVMSGASGLASYAEIALLVFVVVFVFVVIDLVRAGRRYESARLLPLDDEHERPSTPTDSGVKR